MVTRGSRPQIAGEMPHVWLRDHDDYYKEVVEDHRAKDPALKNQKKRIRLKSDRVQCQEMRKALTSLFWMGQIYEILEARRPYLNV